VNIDDPKPEGSTGMAMAQLALRFDPTQFTLTPQDIHLGSIPSSGTGWTLQTIVDQSSGDIGISLASMTPIGSSAGGSLVTIALHEKSTATPGSAAVALVASVVPNGHAFSTVVDDSQGPYTLTPEPTNNGTTPGMMSTISLVGAGANTLVPVEPGRASQDFSPDKAFLSSMAATSADAPTSPISAVADDSTLTTGDPVVEQNANSVTGRLLTLLESMVAAALTNVPTPLLEADLERERIASQLAFATVLQTEEESTSPSRGVFMISAGPVITERDDQLTYDCQVFPATGLFWPVRQTSGNSPTERAADKIFESLGEAAAPVPLETMPRSRAVNDLDKSWDSVQSAPMESKVDAETDALDAHFAEVAESGKSDSE